MLFPGGKSKNLVQPLFWTAGLEKTRALSQNMTNALEGTLTPNLKNVEVTVQNKLHYCRKFSGQNSSMKINKKH